LTSRAKDLARAGPIVPEVRLSDELLESISLSAFGFDVKDTS